MYLLSIFNSPQTLRINSNLNILTVHLESPLFLPFSLPPLVPKRIWGILFTHRDFFFFYWIIGAKGKYPQKTNRKPEIGNLRSQHQRQQRAGKKPCRAGMEGNPGVCDDSPGPGPQRPRSALISGARAPLVSPKQQETAHY